MECPNCDSEIEDSLLFRYIRMKEKSPVVCSTCNEELGTSTIYRNAGRIGGSATSDRKRESSRRNGMLGGRPRKKK